jgi:hypothetical protein
MIRVEALNFCGLCLILPVILYVVASVKVKQSHNSPTEAQGGEEV